MTLLKHSDRVRSLSDLEERAHSLVERVLSTRRPVLLTRHGEYVAVLVELEEYKKLLERAAFAEAIQMGTRATEKEDLQPHEQAANILSTFGVPKS
jgi:prevent-host-death family protein